jgi:hypothetical protein
MITVEVGGNLGLALMIAAIGLCIWAYRRR